MYNPQLDTFIVVADEGSFSKAAEKLFISTTAVIKQINLLENSVGLKLFVRNFRGVTLTEAGKSLYKDAKYIIRYSKDSLKRAEEAMRLKDNTIRIGTSLMTPGQLLMEIWPEIHNINPDLKFKMISFENTPENAREILKNLGENIDIVVGVFDDKLLDYRKCSAFEMSKIELCCGVSMHHRLAQKEILKLDDLKDESIMFIRRGWSSYIDKLRNDIEQKYPSINIVEFPFYNVEVFNQCESEGNVLITVDYWKNVHPLLKTIPVEWDYSIPYGFLHSQKPSPIVKDFLNAINKILK